MLARSDLTFCIPSSGRVRSLMRVKRTLLPQALVFVADEEADEYLEAGLPKADLRTHPNLEGLARIRNFIVQSCPTKVCIMVDDDFGHVMAMPGRKIRIIKRPTQIAEIAYSTAMCANDMKSRLFCWSNQAWPVYYKDYEPFGLKGPASRALGVIGKDVKWDERLGAMVDTDCSLNELMENRFVLTDNRFYWWCGQIAGNPGGLQKLRTSDRLAMERALMKQKWGDFVIFDKKSKVGKSTNTIAVDRKQTWASTSQETK